MFTLLTIDALISLFFGALFLMASDAFWEKIGHVFNRSLFVMDVKLRIHNMAAGLIALSMGIWFVFFALSYDYTSYHFLGIILITVGLLCFTKPDLLLWISKFFSKEILVFDKVLIASRASLGIGLIVVSIYIFLQLFMAVTI